MVATHEMPLTGPAAPSAEETQEAVARARDQVLGGRGPGADQAEIEQWKRQRLTLGAVPAPLARELLHLDTARMRDRPGPDAGADAALKNRRDRTLEAWSPTVSSTPMPGHRPLGAALLGVAVGAAAGVLAARRG